MKTVLVRVNQNSEVVGHKNQNKELKNTKMSHRVEGNRLIILHLHGVI